MLRKQYHVRTIQGDFLAWDVDRLIRLSQSRSRRHTDAAAHCGAAHMALVQQADLAYPVLRVRMDRMHLLIKALLPADELRHLDEEI